MALVAGDTVRVGPAYEMATRARTHHDGWEGLYRVVEVCGDGDLALSRYLGDDADGGDVVVWVSAARCTAQSGR